MSPPPSPSSSNVFIILMEFYCCRSSILLYYLLIYITCIHYKVEIMIVLGRVNTRTALLNIPSPCLSWLSTMNSYSRPGWRLFTVASVIFRERIFMVLHSDVSVGLYLRVEIMHYLMLDQSSVLHNNRHFIANNC